jgi:capsid protein
VSTFKDGTAAQQAYNFVNQNANRLLQDYLKPSLDSAENQAMLNAYTKELNKNATSTLQNNIINPLANNNMIRSSQATNMYNNLSNQVADNISDYTNELLANSKANSWDMISNLMNLYTSGYQGVANETSNALQASVGNKSTSKSSSK